MQDINYVEEFSLLLTRTDIYDTPEQLVSRFIGGLRSQLQNALSQFDPTTLAEAHRRAATFEQQQKTPGWGNQSSRFRLTDQNTSNQQQRKRRQRLRQLALTHQ